MNVYVAGVGESGPVARGKGPAAETMALRAAFDACRDAGIEPAKVDGIVRYSHDGAISAMSLAANLGMEELSFAVDVPHAGGSGAALLDVAIAAVRSGAARTVLCTRTVVAEEWLRQLVAPDPLRPFYLDAPNYLRPVGWTGYLHLFGLLYQEHANRYGTTRADLYPVAEQMRQNAKSSLLDLADPLPALDDYLALPTTVGPFTPLDEFVPADLSCAVIVSAHDRSDRSVGVEIVATAQSQGPEPMSWFDSRPLSPDALDSPSRAVADKLFASAGLVRGDIDVVGLYDCTTFTLLFLLEESGLVERGGAAELARLDGLLPHGACPTNPHGGDLAAGYSHGFRHILEMVRQLRWTAVNQVSAAEHALVLGPPAGPTSGAILRRVAL
ncbi:thiolase C-terminal domain-containing protein [Pseudonocardia xishanensis]|uniref:Thiolase C-terminal domain-containing protein n=1 Tax=Pseudonocardia xishanensis TaxID=630995 RepID=A0ABP8RY93_9PSEU